MLRRPCLILFGLCLGQVLAATQGATCNSTTPCPASAPCCSDFGFCGTGHFCLGGCNPLASNNLNSCSPEPVCKDATYTFQDNSRILSNSTYYNGDASQYDWVVDKGNIMNTNSSGGELALLLTQSNGGTRLSSTRYVHYGTLTATLKSGRWGGVVATFITMSGIKDEIDWEFPGANTTKAQSNVFWQGNIPTQTNGQTHSVSSDTFSNYHDYTIDWQPDTLTFKIDGQVVRTVKKSDMTVGSVANYPSTPSRIQLSLWPAGISSMPAGTVDWAGGMIDWNTEDYKSAGHYYMLVKSVSVQCTDPAKPGPDVTSYLYGANQTLDIPSVQLSNHSTINGAPGFAAAAVVSVRYGLVVAVFSGILGLIQFI